MRTGVDLWRSTSVPGPSADGTGYSLALDSWGGKAILSFWADADVKKVTSYRYDLSGAPAQTPEALNLTGIVRILRAPLLRPATASSGPTPPTTTSSAPVTTTTIAPAPVTTTTPAGGAPSWDQIRNARIPALCQHAPTSLVDGKDVTLGADEGSYELLRTLDHGISGWCRGSRQRCRPVDRDRCSVRRRWRRVAQTC